MEVKFDCFSGWDYMGKVLEFASIIILIRLAQATMMKNLLKFV